VYKRQGQDVKRDNDGLSAGLGGVSYGINRHHYRARAKIVRYARHNKLDILGTLTYADQTSDFKQVQFDYYQFTRRLKRHLGYIPPQLGIPEQHKTGNYHIQTAHASFIPKTELASIWGHGFVEVRRFRASEGRSAAEGVGRYAAKSAGGYVSKSVGVTDRPPGAARFWQTQGFAPVPVVLEVDACSSYDVLRDLVAGGSLGEPTWIGSFEDVPQMICGRSIPLLAA